MNNLILLGIVVFVLTWIVARVLKDKFRWYEPFSWATAMSLGIVGITAMVTNLDSIENDRVYVKRETKEIYSVSRENLTSGSFFLGSGHIDQEPHYFFYEQAYGGAILKWYPARDATIASLSDSTDHPPSVVYFELMIESSWLEEFFFHGTWGQKADHFQYPVKRKDEWSYRPLLYVVPKTTIVQEYKLK